MVGENPTQLSQPPKSQYRLTLTRKIYVKIFEVNTFHKLNFNTFNKTFVWPPKIPIFATQRISLKITMIKIGIR